MCARKFKNHSAGAWRPMARHVLLLLSALASCFASCQADAAAEFGGVKLIVAGLPRSGCQSLSDAVAILGYRHTVGIDYQGTKDIFRPWRAFLFEGGPFEDALEVVRKYGWNVTVDYPWHAAYKELMEAYPEAKVLLTVRDTPRAWSKSFIHHLPPPHPIKRWVGYLCLRFLAGFSHEDAIVRRRILDVTHFNGCDWFGFHEANGDPDKEEAVLKGCDEGYERWVEKVKRTVPPDRLLVFNNKQGWEPLCAFLGVPVPDVPYPHADRANRNYIYLILYGVAVWSSVGLGLCWLCVRCRRKCKRMRSGEGEKKD